MRLLDDKPLNIQKLQYKDFSEWFINYIKTDHYKNQEKFWLDTLKGDIKCLNIPTDFERPQQQVFEADVVIIHIKEKIEVLKQHLNILNTNMYAMFLSFINILLYKYCGNETIIIGTETSGRRHADLFEIAGMFVGLIPLKNKVFPEYSFQEFVSTVTKNTLQSLDNQDYQFNDLIRKLNLTRVNNSNPLFSIIFGNDRFFNNQLQNVEPQKNSAFELVSFDYINQSTNWDLRFGMIEKSDEIVLSIKYARALFKHSTCQKMAKDLLFIIDQVIANPNLKIKDIRLDHDLSIPKPKRLLELDADFAFND
jgi:non-ribosomal peptide synthetase component F